MPTLWIAKHCWCLGFAKWHWTWYYVGTTRWVVNQIQLNKTLATSGLTLVENGCLRKMSTIFFMTWEGGEHNFNHFITTQI